jgi:hypothetical protein
MSSGSSKLRRLLGGLALAGLRLNSFLEAGTPDEFVGILAFSADAWVTLAPPSLLPDLSYPPFSVFARRAALL